MIITYKIQRALAEVDLRACARNYGEDPTEANARKLKKAALKYAVKLALCSKEKK